MRGACSVHLDVTYARRGDTHSLGDVAAIRLHHTVPDRRGG